MHASVLLLTPHTLSHRTAEETLALGYLASVLRNNGFRVTIIDGWLRGINQSDILELLRLEVPDVICMSCYRSNLEQAASLLQVIRMTFGDIPAICGGYGPTFHDLDFLNAGFQVAVRGEAEHIITPLIYAITSHGDLSSIQGITYLQGASIIRTERVGPIQDLDSIPFPARDEVPYAIKRKNPVHVCTSRGCEAHCSFCSIFAFALGASPKHRWRHRSTQNIVDEIRSLYEQFGVTHIKFVDDSFLEPPRDERWVSVFASLLQRYNIPLRFRTQVRADRLTRNIVSGLKEVGWFATSIGIENAAPSALVRMGKSATLDDNQRALELLQEHEVYVQMGMILFDEATTMAELELNYSFLLSQPWVVTKGIFTEMFAAIGTPYTQKLARKGLLQSNSTQQNCWYQIQDPYVRRVHEMLGIWHKSHAALYDWVIDSITAPKVLPDDGYRQVHALCRELFECDMRIFRRALDQVRDASVELDQELIASAITEYDPIYATIQSKIQVIYDAYALVYDGILNPFLR